AVRPAPEGQAAVAVTPEGVVVEWHTPAISVETRGAGRLAVEVAGYERTSQPGQPDLPVSSVLLALPPGAAPSVHVEAVTETVSPLAGTLALVPRPVGVQLDAAGSIVGGAFAPAEAEARFSPAVVELTPA